MAALPKPVPQELLIEEAVKAVPLPKGIRLNRIYFDSDQTGDPAIYVVFTLARGFGIAPARIRSIGDLKSAVMDAIDALHLDRIPYVRFEDAK